jgi:hypothetical protein
VGVLGTVINCVLVVLTLAVVWFAWQTVREARNATTAARDTVTAVGKLLAVAQETAASSAASVEAARQTVEIAQATREADERHRQLEQLREVGRTVQRIKLSALEAVRLRESVGQPAGPRWKSADQNALGILLVGVEPPLPACKALVGESQAGQVLDKAAAAEAELETVFRGLASARRSAAHLAR